MARGRPPERPRARAAARPARVRSRATSRSNSARGAEEVEDELASRSRSVDGLLEALELDPPVPELVHRLDQVSERAPHPVEPSDDQGVAWPERRQHLGQLRPLVQGPGSGVRENPLAACLSQRVALEVEVLLGGRNAGVAEQTSHAR